MESERGVVGVEGAWEVGEGRGGRGCEVLGGGGEFVGGCVEEVDW